MLFYKITLLYLYCNQIINYVNNISKRKHIGSRDKKSKFI